MLFDQKHLFFISQSFYSLKTINIRLERIFAKVLKTFFKNGRKSEIRPIFGNLVEKIAVFWTVPKGPIFQSVFIHRVFNLHARPRYGKVFNISELFKNVVEKGRKVEISSNFGNLVEKILGILKNFKIFISSFSSVTSTSHPFYENFQTLGKF